MCMITYIPRDVALNDDILEGIENGAVTNDDGHGWAVAAETGLMLTGKSLNYYRAIEELENARAEYPEAPALFHSRWATHGSIREENCHPFPVGPHSVMAHNGIMPQAFLPSLENPEDVTDSRIFAAHLEQRKSGLWSRRERQRIGRMIPGSKLCILSVSPRFTRPTGFLVNASAGVWRYGVWFSNYGFEDNWGSRWTYSTGSKATSLGTRSLFPQRDCRFCYGAEAVTDDGYCEWCDMCQDCESFIEDCECYGPSTAEVVRDRHQALRQARRDSSPFINWVQVDDETGEVCKDFTGTCEHKVHAYVPESNLGGE